MKAVRRVARFWKRWEWEYYHSGYGSAFGRRCTRRGAARAVERAAADFYSESYLVVKVPGKGLR